MSRKISIRDFFVEIERGDSRIRRRVKLTDEWLGPADMLAIIHAILRGDSDAADVDRAEVDGDVTDGAGKTVGFFYPQEKLPGEL
jgi:hypothetical protein